MPNRPIRIRESFWKHAVQHLRRAEVFKATGMKEEKMLTQREAAKRLQISVKTLQILRRQRRINFFRLGYRTIRIAESEIQQFINRREQLWQ